MLERYELLYEAGLVAEAARDGRPAARQWDDLPELGRPMAFDHRRILATAMGRLRGKLKYRPVVFELLPPEFTLLELQKTVEAISGTLLHKQNFRRLVEQGGLVGDHRQRLDRDRRAPGEALSLPPRGGAGAARRRDCASRPVAPKSTSCSEELQDPGEAIANETWLFRVIFGQIPCIFADSGPHSMCSLDDEHSDDIAL